ncbi:MULTISPECIES: DJ-1/PfpI family protein [Paenibacillus]|uniref:DJ-1/PfpI family protein n=1 Tax=Paenibacillus TaxID=44249 RepID=UPI0022B87924|nr:DJ-1/PfpI family protein [Paenibacillus caseinilyticus]MCZ8522524.1 DJ-1/PfpI family protein [Paenibacillus caseinilyticus]
MKKVICFISENFADFEITLVLHKIKNIGKREVVTVGNRIEQVKSESGLIYKPNLSVKEALQLDDIEGLILPGGPINTQSDLLTQLLVKLDREQKMLAAICNGPQYLGRSGILNNRKFTTSCSLDRIRILGVEDPFPRQTFINCRVITDGHVITAKGRAFIDFSFEIFAYLGIYQNIDEQEQLYNDILNR